MLSARDKLIQEKHLKHLPNYYDFSHFKETVSCSKTQQSLTAIHSNKQGGRKNKSGKSFDLIVKGEENSPRQVPKTLWSPASNQPFQEEVNDAGKKMNHLRQHTEQL